MNILRALLVTAVLLFVWSVTVRKLPPELDSAQTMWGSNLISAQDYLYGEIEAEDVVIVGSSLTENLLIREVAGRRVHNLGLGGQGVFDGLHLVAAASGQPGTVFIEMNVIIKEENAQFREVVLSPVANAVKLHLPVLRQRNQPVGVLKGLLFNKKARETVNANERKDRPISQMSLGIKQKVYANPIPNDKLMGILRKLQRQVAELRQRGMRVVFFEAPVDPSLCSAPKAISIREGFHEIFPVDTFAYLHQPPCGGYQTTDGHHLGERSLARYSEWLRGEMEQLMK
jgi:hypothetical protein